MIEDPPIKISKLLGLQPPFSKILTTVTSTTCPKLIIIYGWTGDWPHD
jgi:hypothetical protein